MDSPKGCPLHICAPKEFRSVPNFTGHHELDAVIQKNDNPDIARRMAMYSGRGGGAYMERTGYTGYNPDEGDL